MNVLSFIKRLFGALWGALDRIRKVLHLIVLLVLLFAFIASLVPTPIPVPRSAALVIAPQGALVEQLSGNPLERALAKARGIPLKETLMKDLVAF